MGNIIVYRLMSFPNGVQFKNDVENLLAQLTIPKVEWYRPPLGLRISSNLLHLSPDPLVAHVELHVHFHKRPETYTSSSRDFALNVVFLSAQDFGSLSGHLLHEVCNLSERRIVCPGKSYQIAVFNVKSEFLVPRKGGRLAVYDLERVNTPQVSLQGMADHEHTIIDKSLSIVSCSSIHSL